MFPRPGASLSEENLSHVLQDLRLRQQTTLAPRLQQSIHLLQMSALEFTTTVQQALATNPFLEDADETEAQDDAPAPPTASEPPATSEPPPEPPSYAGDYPTRGAAAQPGVASDAAAWVPAILSLHERLSQALGAYVLSERDRALAEFIVDGLDDDGYLRQELAQLAGAADFDPPPDASEWQAALHLVQQLDAPGLAARDLPECLALQIRACSRLDPAVRDAALVIVAEHLQRLARSDYPGMRRALRCSEPVLRQACGVIRGLDPKPGRRYAHEPPSYVVPDVVVSKQRQQWLVVPNRGAMPHARLHQAYADLFRRARMDERSPMAQELQEARWLVRNVEQRYATIRRVAEAIVQRQQMFFEFGQIALRPLMLREVADELEMHESTVSRATANKYMSTPRGVFEFRHFFSRELSTESGGTCSAAAVRALIREYIDAEDPRMPLSDVTLAERLAGDGIVVARRTVSKYRLQLRLPAADARRQYY